MSIWVNSGWRSARRSSSGSHFTIWKIPVVAGDHEELLDELGGLGQRRTAPVHAAGNEVILAPSGVDLVRKGVSTSRNPVGGNNRAPPGQPVPENDIALHLRGVAGPGTVLEAKVLRCLPLFIIDGKGSGWTRSG